MTVLVAVAAGCGSAAKAAGLVPIGAGLRGPSGLRASVYATGLRHVSAFALDGRGRLWVTTSGATTHAGDGVYLVARAGARPVKVVSGLKAPLGLVWVGRRLYVASLGRVDAFGGLRGTRFTTRTTIVKGPVSGGENNNLVLAPDGRLMMSVSASCDHCVPSSVWSAAIVSFRPDGSDLRLYASRVRAGFGLAFYPGTSDLFVSMNHATTSARRRPATGSRSSGGGRAGVFRPVTGRAAPSARASRARPRCSTRTRPPAASRS